MESHIDFLIESRRAGRGEPRDSQQRAGHDFGEAQAHLWRPEERIC